MAKTNIQGTREQLVIFQLNQQTFGVDIIRVQEIIKMVPITHVPRTHEFIKGVINLRGKIIPVIDLYQRLNIKHPEGNPDWRIIILEQGEIVVGILVDGVSEVLSLDSEQIESGSELAMGLDSKYINGIGKWKDELIVILDLVQVLAVMRNQEDLSARVG